MTDARSSANRPDPPAPQARDPAARRRRGPARRPRAGGGIAPVGAGPAAEVLPPPETRSELRDWVKDNATLLSNASFLISLAALTLNLLPEVGVFAPYVKALVFAAALLLLAELHHQWPEDLRLHVLRTNARPANHSWRMTAFAVVLQAATLVFAAWATLTNPIILLPLTALAVVVAFRQWYFRRHGGLLARGFGVVALVAVLLLSELLMVVVWAAVTGEAVTLELWAEDRPGVRLRIGE